MKKKAKRLGILLLTFLVGVMQPIGVLAYFERGPVGVDVGEHDLVLEVGQSKTISVSLSPRESSQLPGCGMAECPQICGEKECLDENGECTCAGTDYQTYTAFATVASDNTGVAAAEYMDGGILQVTAVSPGSATITVTASLRQFTSTSTEIFVTVNELPAPEPQVPADDPGSPPEGSASGIEVHPVSDDPAPNAQHTAQGNGAESDPQQNGLEVNTVDGQQGHSGEGTSGQTAGPAAASVTGGAAPRTVSGSASVSSDKKADKAKKAKKADETTAPAAVSQDGTGQKDDEGTKTIKSDRGEILMVPIQPGKMGKEELESIRGKEMYVDFQMKDAAETVLYTWEFYGKDLKEAKDLDMSVDIGTDALEECGYGTASDSLYLAFGHEGALPGTASMYIRVAESFSDDQVLNLYQYDPEKGIALMQEGLTVKNGYVMLTMEHCSDYILTTERWDTEEKSHGGIGPVYAYVAAAAVIVAVGAVCVVLRKKKRA